MSTDNVSADALKAQIIGKVKSIAQQKDAKKDMAKSYNDSIKQLQEELDKLMEQLDEEQRLKLDDAADAILEDNP